MRSPTRSGRRSVLENHFYHKSIEFYGIPLHFSPIFCTKSLSLKGPHFIRNWVLILFAKVYIYINGCTAVRTHSYSTFISTALGP